MNTVKVRIAVAVDKDGDWSCRGDSLAASDVHMEHVSGDMAFISPVSLYWITAELPIPSPSEVAGVVEGEA